MTLTNRGLGPAAPVGSRGKAPGLLPHAIAPDGGLADHAARLLRDGAPGVLLCGPRAPALVTGVLDALRSLPVAPVRFDAAAGTVETLRAEVERIHAQRPHAGVPLLLVIDEADGLAGELPQELERAAAAAAEFGGLSFLFVARYGLADLFRQQALPALARCVEASLRCDDPVIVPETGEWFGSPVPADGAAAPARTSRLLLAGGILALMAVVLAVGIARLGPRHAGRREVATLAVPPALRAAPGAQIRLPLLPIVPKPRAGPEAGPGAGARATARPEPPPPPAPPPRLAPASLLLIAGPGDTLASLYAQVYRGMTPPPLAQVAAVNPATVGVGTRLVFPAPAAGWTPARQAGPGGN